MKETNFHPSYTHETKHSHLFQTPASPALSELKFNTHQFSDVKLGRGADTTVYESDRSGTLQWVGQLDCSITGWPINPAF